MATIIVGHKVIDLDCGVSMLALATALREIVGFRGEIRFALIPQGSTYKGIKVDPTRQYELLDGDRIYHVDCGSDECGRGLFDHHRSGCEEPSSAIIIDRVFRLSGTLPEWKRLIRWATRADQGTLTGGCTLASLISGRRRRFGPGHDAQIFRFLRECVADLLANERVRVAAVKIQAEIVSELQIPELEDVPILQIEEISGFGRVGLIVGPEGLGGSFRNQLEIEKKCRLTVSFGTNEGSVGIMSCFSGNGEPVDLRGLGVVQAIRKAEARARGIGITPKELRATGDVCRMKWFAHEVDGNRIANLFNGSAKVDLKKGEETRLPWEQIIKIVKDCITTSIAAEE